MSNAVTELGEAVVTFLREQETRNGYDQDFTISVNCEMYRDLMNDEGVQQVMGFATNPADPRKLHFMGYEMTVDSNQAARYQINVNLSLHMEGIVMMRLDEDNMGALHDVIEKAVGDGKHKG